MQNPTDGLHPIEMTGSLAQHRLTINQLHTTGQQLLPRLLIIPAQLHKPHLTFEPILPVAVLLLQNYLLLLPELPLKCQHPALQLLRALLQNRDVLALGRADSGVEADGEREGLDQG
jgi:hypothetical protein